MQRYIMVQGIVSRSEADSDQAGFNFPEQNRYGKAGSKPDGLVKPG
jgi:hypothetical protein